MALITNQPKAAPCPFCLMKRRAIRHAFVSMVLSGSVLAAAIFTLHHFNGI